MSLSLVPTGFTGSAMRGAACAAAAALLLGCVQESSPERYPPEAHRSPELDNYSARLAWIEDQLGIWPPSHGGGAAAPPPPPPTVSSLSSDWAPVGSSSVWGGTQSWSGRVNAIAVDPTDPNFVYLGSDGGGVWRSADAGSTWTPLSDFQPSLNISALAIDPISPTTIYAGTGLQYVSDVGILKTTDGGTTWTVSELPPQFATDRRITTIAIRPGASAEVLAGAQFYGVFRSQDAGTTWANVLVAQGGSWAAVQFASADVAYAAIGGPPTTGTSVGVFKSTDGGISWGSPLGGGLPVPKGPIHIWVSGTNPQLLYALFADAATGAAQGLYRSADGGISWTSRTVPRYPDGQTYCVNYCLFNNVIAADPQNPDMVFVGGFGLFRSTDGGISWTDVSNSPIGSTYLHADQHALAFNPSGTRLYAGGDGGIWSTPIRLTDLSSYEWTSLNATLGIGEFYSVAVGPGLYLGGTQDNGTQLKTVASAWESVVCGDGLSTAIANATQPIFFTTCYGPGSAFSLQRSADGSNWSSVPVGPGRNLKPAIEVDPSSPQRVYTGTTRLYRSDDAGLHWMQVSDDFDGTSDSVSAIGISASEPERVYAGTALGKLFARQPNGWIEISPPYMANHSISAIAVGRQNPSHVVVAFRATPSSPGVVYETPDSGNTWISLGSPPPDLRNRLSDVVGVKLQEPLQFTRDGVTVGLHSSGRVVAAVRNGVFQYSRTDGSWQRLGSGLPRAIVTSLTFRSRSPRLVASTYGRGVWELIPDYTDVQALVDIEPIDPRAPNDRTVRVGIVNRGNVAANNVRIHMSALTSNTPAGTFSYALIGADPGVHCRPSPSSGAVRLDCDLVSLRPGGAVSGRIRISATPLAASSRPVTRSLSVSGVAAGDDFDPEEANNEFHLTINWPASAR